VWLSLRHVGRSGYEQMLREDIALSRHLFDLVSAHAELEPGTQQLSITTFRYRPADADTTQPQWREYLNLLNEQLLQELQRGGEAYVSNAVLNGRIFLRACIVNFRTTSTDIEALVEIVARTGRKLDSALRPAALARSDVT
jgi:aromatic-L-amino-acid decarboxylase